VKNLKSTSIELTEKRYVDMPARRQKEIPIESQHALASTFNVGKDALLNRNTLIIGADEDGNLDRDVNTGINQHHFSVAQTPRILNNYYTSA